MQCSTNAMQLYNPQKQDSSEMIECTEVRSVRLFVEEFSSMSMLTIKIQLKVFTSQRFKSNSLKSNFA